MAATETRVPEIKWFQRSSDSDAERNYIDILIVAPDLGPDPASKSAEPATVKITPTHVTFSGYSTTKKVNYHVEMELFREVDPEKSTYKIAEGSPEVHVVLRKKDLDAKYWKQLLKAGKVHYVRTNFAPGAYVDEDEQEEAQEEAAGMDQLDFSKLGGDMGGMPGMEGLQGMMPGMEGLQGMGGMPGMAAMGGDDAGMDDEDEEDMPELEGEEKAAAPSSTSKPKIEELP